MTTRQLKQLRRYMPTENGKSMGSDKAMKQGLSSTNNQNLNEKIYQAMGWLSVLSLITCFNTLRMCHFTS